MVKQSLPNYLRDNIPVTWRTMEEYCNALEKNGISMNLAPFIGHGTIRANVLGFQNRAPNIEELKQMKKFIREAMEQGAFGLSTGLFYAPGSFAQTDEIVELCREVHSCGGFYASHIRNEGDYGLDAVKEAIDVGRKSGVPVQISHLKASGRENWGKMQTLLNSREKVRDEIENAPTSLDWENLLRSAGYENIMVVSYEPDRNLIGKRIVEIATLLEKDPLNTIFDLIIGAGAQGVSAVYFDMDENDVIQGLQHPNTCVSSDGRAISKNGPFAQMNCHPRWYGTFPRVLGYFVREKQIFPLQTAIRKMTSLPAQKLGLTTRGLIREGYAADLVIFDPTQIKSQATFLVPHNYATGIEFVLVNGVLVFEKGKHTQKKPGQVLKHSQR